jgi:squalene-hopene/tetraprenyl-beta-curcumene cyclase
VAAGTLAAVDADTHRPQIQQAVDWLLNHCNDDAGWGDTPNSPSNLAATLLVWASAGFIGSPADTLTRSAEQWLGQTVGSLSPDSVAAALRDRYGRDRTFAVPILAFCAAAGRFGPGRSAWRAVSSLPFELGVLSHRQLRWLRLPVVSYALPALIAVGQARHAHRPTRNPITRLLRRVLWSPTTRRLGDIQPGSGGFLEAAPLSGFVATALAVTGRGDHPVTRKAVDFLVQTARPDGSWPIDTDLSIWLTSQAAAALCRLSPSPLGDPDRAELLAALLGSQHRKPHSYTGAAPGGWAWTDRPGGVPDADDTAGVLLAVAELGGPDQPAVLPAVERGCRWLIDLANRDGGWPTFCRGWGKLPFDRSCSDITAHALAALDRWAHRLPPADRLRAERAILRGLGYLQREQQSDGSFLPLWFGCQQGDDQTNPAFGTARVVRHLAALRSVLPPATLLTRATGWLLDAQGPRGGWPARPGLDANIEQTAQATAALCAVASSRPDDPTLTAAIGRGADWLIDATDEGQRFPADPIGLYFATLWYAEKLYPVIYTLDALAAARDALGTSLV